MPEETIRIEVSDEEVDETVAKIEGAIAKKGEVEDIKTSAEEAKETGDEVLGERENIKGMNLATRRIMRQVPGLRAVSRLLSLIKLQMRIAPAAFALIIAFQALRTIISWLEGREREAREYRMMIREYRGLTSRRQVEAWIEEDKRRTQESYRSAVPL
jgi:hypothetical protein